VKKGFATETQRHREDEEKKSASIDLYYFLSVSLCLCGKAFDLDFHDLVFFVFGEVADLGHVLVSQFLHVVKPASLFVF